MLFDHSSLSGGTTVRGNFDVAPDGRFLLDQPVAEGIEERDRIVFPSTLRLVLNWTDEMQRLLAGSTK